MEDMEGEGPKKLRYKKGTRSSVGYARKPPIKATGQITTRNITTIKSRVNDQFFSTLPVPH